MTHKTSLADLVAGDEVVAWWENLELSIRALNAIRNFYIPLPTLARAQRVTEQEWMRMPNCGRVTVLEIMIALHGGDLAKKSKAKALNLAALERVRRYLAVRSTQDWPTDQIDVTSAVGLGRHWLCASDLDLVVRMAGKA